MRRIVVTQRWQGVPRAERRRELAEQVARVPGWHMAETSHYFVLFEFDDRRYERELAETVEAVRRLYRIHFPHPLADPVPVHDSPNVLRVCRDQTSFHEYGGAGGSVGYWSHATGEVVFFAGERRALRSTLFFEYLHVSYDDPPVAPWFVHGHAEWYGDFMLEEGVWDERPQSLELERVRKLVAEDRARPLLDLVALDGPSFNPDPTANLVQAWSFVRFLRTGGPELAGWDEGYGEMLDTYLAVIVATRDPQLALDQAFAGVDRLALEAAWRAWVLNAS